MHQSEKEIKEELLILRKSIKDPRFFAPVYEKYYKKIFLFIYRRTENETLTADLTSQVFLKALVNLRSYTFKGLPFSAWLFRVAANEVNDFFRKSSKKWVVTYEERDLQELKEQIPEMDDPDPEQALLGALEHLDQPEMFIIELRFFEKRSFKEIGLILNITENNAKVRTYRILDKLKKVLSQLRQKND